jgi:DNA invertase Pin-like site-specific DNA recombinase
VEHGSFPLTGASFPDGAHIMSKALTFAYLRSSLDPEIATVESQRAAVEEHCRRVGLGEPGIYIDRGDSGMTPVFRRVAGCKLEERAKRGDHIIVPTLDRIADSLVEAARALDGWARRGITVHLLHPRCRFDPDDPGCRAFITMVGEFAEAGVRMMGIRARATAEELRVQGRRRSRHAPFGHKFVKRAGKFYLEPEPAEMAIRDQVMKMKAMNYSIDQIRMYLAYEWRVRNRNGNEFGYSEIRNMIRRGLDEMARAKEQADSVSAASGRNT